MSQEENWSLKKQNKHKTRRGYRGKFTVKNKFNVIGINANGIMSKLLSLNHLITELTPSVICLQETKLRKAGKIKINGYTIFELVRKSSSGGGLATMVKSELKPVWVSEGDDEVELLVIEVHIQDLPIRIINAYGPQECDTIERKSAFWSRISSEIENAIEADVGFIIQMDGNLHCGSDIIKNDPNKINANGRLFSTFLKINPVNLLNASNRCQGSITRERVKERKIEQAILDYVLVCDKIYEYFSDMIIDEDRTYALTSYQNKRAVNSDHFTLIINFDINFKRQKPIREEFYNFKNTECQQKYTEILNTENNLIKCFDNDEDIEAQSNKWFSELNKIFQRSFRKIRLKETVKETEATPLLKERAELKQAIKKDPNNEDLISKLEKVTETVTNIVSQKNRDKPFETFSSLDQTEGENFSQGIWNIKKKEYPRVSAPVPAAKKDINGKMVTNPNDIKKLYLETLTHRLRHRPIKKENSDLFELQQKLCQKRLLASADEKSPDWSEEDVIKY